jgi:hypothetical protein
MYTGWQKVGDTGDKVPHTYRLEPGPIDLRKIKRGEEKKGGKREREKEKGKKKEKRKEIKKKRRKKTRKKTKNVNIVNSGEHDILF